MIKQNYLSIHVQLIVKAQLYQLFAQGSSSLFTEPPIFVTASPFLCKILQPPLCLIFGDLIPLKFPLCKLDCKDSRDFTADTIHTIIVYHSHLWNHLWPLSFINFCIVVCILDFVGLPFKKKPSQINTLLELLTCFIDFSKSSIYNTIRFIVLSFIPYFRNSQNWRKINNKIKLKWLS